MPNIAALITVAAVMFAALGAITLIAHIAFCSVFFLLYVQF